MTYIFNIIISLSSLTIDIRNVSSQDTICYRSLLLTRVIIAMFVFTGISFNAVCQNSFFKRKYTKGHFIERMTHVRHKKTAGSASTSAITLAQQTGMEEQKNVVNVTAIFRSDTALSVDAYKSLDSLALIESDTKGYSTIGRHNTIAVKNADDVYCSGFRQLNVKTTQQTVEQELKTRSVVMQKMSDQGMVGGFFGDLLEDIKRFLLICLLLIMVFALFASVMAIATYPVASLSWGFGIAACIYATMGIIISITALLDRDGGRFMQVLKIIFCIVSFALLFVAGAG